MFSIADLQYKHRFRYVVAIACISLCSLPQVFAADAISPYTQSAGGQVLYAKVGDREITIDEYNQTYTRTVRQRYYHSKPPETELAAVRQEIADGLIERQLLLIEAERLGLVADEKSIQVTLEKYDERYADSPRWNQERDKLLLSLNQKLVEDDLLQQLENSVKNIAPPSEKQLNAFYEKNPDKFTEPTQQKLSLILLVVDPSSSAEIWQAAMDKGHKLVAELKEGADFAEYARTYSGDISAATGGDMGYVHREMLSEAVQQSIDALQPGQISDAIRTLQGVAILRLDERQPERLRGFAEVRNRASQLWIREHSETAWYEFKNKLMIDTPVTVFVDVANNNNET